MNKDEIVITSAVRTAVGSLGKSLKNESSEKLGSAVITEVVKKSKLKKENVDEIIMGQVLTGGTGQNPARQAAIRSGIPKEKPAYVVNQVCGSGIRSIVSGFRSSQVINTEPIEIILLVRRESLVLWGPRNVDSQRSDIPT